MSSQSKIKEWTEKGEFFAGRLYKEDNFPLFWLVKKVLSKVEIADEYVEALKQLSEKGTVVYALKNKSQLNSLIIRESSARKGIPRPVYCCGINMIFLAALSCSPQGCGFKSALFPLSQVCV